MLLDNIESTRYNPLVADMIGYLGDCQGTYLGDKRDDMHIGMMTRDSSYIAMFHLLEYGLINHLSAAQWKAVLKWYSTKIYNVINKYDSRPGSHSGIRGNINLYAPVREYHCKWNKHLHFAAQKNGAVAWYEMGETNKTLLAVLADGSIKIHSTVSLD